MNSSECRQLVSQLASSPLATKWEVKEPYAGVFVKNRTNDFVVSNHGFDERYGMPRLMGGRYVTLSDIRNLFYVGTAYGKNKVMGVKPKWDAGFRYVYRRNCILWDDDGNRYVWAGAQHSVPPTSGSRGWEPYKAVARFKGATNVLSSITPDTEPFLFPLDLYFPDEGILLNNTYRVASFTASDLGGAGIYSFSYTTRTKHFEYGRLDSFDGGDSSGSVVVKLSPHSDLIENPDHADSALVVLSASVIRPNGIDVNSIGDYLLWTWWRTPPTLVPISANMRYYLYITYVNARSSLHMKSPSDTASLYVYPFRRILEWPG